MVYPNQGEADSPVPRLVDYLILGLRQCMSGPDDNVFGLSIVLGFRQCVSGPDDDMIGLFVVLGLKHDVLGPNGIRSLVVAKSWVS
jgi:hypothetical protein